MSICRITVVASLLFLLVPDAVAQEGYERNDAWSTRDQAARRGLTDASNASREHQGSGRGAVEYGGWIYETHDGGYGYTSPYTSHDQDTISGLGDGVIANPPGSSSDQSYEPRLPTGERIVGVYHNHPNYGTHDTEHFSGPDLNFAELYNIPIYLITPQNDYIKYDPDLHDPADFDFAHDNDEVESYVDDDESRVAHAEGEPHLGTHDGRTFDFQAAGEFIAIQSDEDDLTVMLRFEHYAGLNFISVVTGVSVAVGSDRVGIYASPPHLMINGEIANANNEPPVGIVVLSDGDTVTLTTAAGDKIVARRRHNEWLDVEFAIASARQGRIQGLLGDFDGDPENDFRTRDGELVDMTSGSSGERSQKLYGFWGASWRVGQPESIFDYAHGKTAGDYQDFDIPRAGKTYADLARDTKFTAAAKMCRDAGTYRKTALEHCIFDIVVTGDTRFADTYRDEVGISYATVVAADAGVEISGTISSPGETTRHRILVRKAGQQFFVAQERFDKALDLVNVGLFDESGQSQASKCLGCGNLGLFTVDSPGTYYLKAGGVRETATGKYTLRYWYVPEPDRFSINLDTVVAPDRPGPGAGQIERPGGADEYRFYVAAGTTLRVRIEQFAPEVDLVTWQIADTNRNIVAQRCLGCRAEEFVALDEAGAYVLRVGTTDRDRGTGTYTISLASVQ